MVEALARFSSVAAEQAAIERSKEASWGRGLSSSFLGIWARHARLDPRDEAVEAARRDGHYARGKFLNKELC